MRISAAAAVAACVAIGGAEARGWLYVEHQEIGTVAYRRACERLEQRLTHGSEAMHERFEIACGNLSVVAEIYGQATALAGDRLDDPEDFLVRGGDWKAANRRHYYTVQLTNVRHFHPASLREWSRYHRTALDRATLASELRGRAAIDTFQRAFYYNAFADHFLQDSYAAGHMGFNRAASSVAASLMHHDHWNRRGRHVRNRAGEAWITYGDGRLNDEPNAAGRERVIAATAMSAYGLVSTFVFGTRDHDHELELWRQVPFLVGARPLPGLLTFEDEEATAAYRPLEAINRPARIDRVVDLALVAMSTSSESRRTAVAALLGFDAALPLLATQVHVSVGAISPHDQFEPRFAAQLELRRNIGLSFNGLLSHHVAAGFLWEARPDAFTSWIMLAYMPQLEIGRDLIQLQIGPTLDTRDIGVGAFFALGYGRVFGVAGGGIR